MEVSENNGAEGSSDKEESSYNLAVETFVEPANDQVVPPPPPPLGSVYMTYHSTSSEVRPKTHTQPLSEQSSLTHNIHLVPQQVTSSSSYSSEIERHSLNTGSSNSHGGMVRYRLYSL